MVQKVEHPIGYLSFKPITAPRHQDDHWQISVDLGAGQTVSAVGASQQAALRQLTPLLVTNPAALSTLRLYARRVRSRAPLV
jgi:hypothetical protein